MEEREIVAILKPVGVRSLNGMSSSYDPSYPFTDDDAPMSRPEFDAAISKVNDALVDHWPCMACTGFAYGCCLCTLGLSLYCSTSMVGEAESRARMQIGRLNAQSSFQTTQLCWELRRIWYLRKSWIEISLPRSKKNT
jgi:hypothetical protein